MLLASLKGLEDEESDILVAVKVLKIGTGNPKAREDFDKELGAMAQLQHANIVKLLAKCTIEEPSCMVFEFMERGALIDFLRNSEFGENTHLSNSHETEDFWKHELTLRDLKAIVRQVCEALCP